MTATDASIRRASPASRRAPTALAFALLLAGREAAGNPASEAAFAQGEALAKDKRHAEAAEKFEGAVAADPRDPSAWYALASARRRSGRCDRAIVAYRRFIELAPSTADPYYGLGLCLRDTGDRAAAIKALKQYVALETRESSRKWVEHANSVVQELAAAAPVPPPNTPPAKASVSSPGHTAYLEAQVLRDQGRIEESIAKFRQSIAADPRYMLPRAALGELLLKIRRDDEAIEVFRAAVDRNPGYPLAWYELAFALRVKGRAAEAIAAYDRYIKLKPSDPDPYYGLARAYQQAGKPNEAKKAYQTYLSLEKRPSERRWVESAEAQLKALASAP